MQSHNNWYTLSDQNVILDASEFSICRPHIGERLDDVWPEHKESHEPLFRRAREVGTSVGVIKVELDGSPLVLQYVCRYADGVVRVFVDVLSLEAIESLLESVEIISASRPKLRLVS